MDEVISDIKKWRDRINLAAPQWDKSTRTRLSHCLSNEGFMDWDHIAKTRRIDVARTPELGRKCLALIDHILAQQGYAVQFGGNGVPAEWVKAQPHYSASDDAPETMCDPICNAPDIFVMDRLA